MWALCTLLGHERAIGSSIKLKYRKDFAEEGKRWLKSNEISTFI